MLNSAEANDSFSYIVLKTSLAQYQKSPTDLPAEQLETVEKQARTQLKIQSIVLKSQEARDVSIPQSVLDSALDEVIKRYEEADDFAEDLERNNISMEGFQKALQRELHVDAVLDRVASQAADVSDLDATIYYHYHPEKFQSPEKRKIKHILITKNDDYAENTHAVALQRIEKIKETLKAKPKKFETLAQQHSECPTAMHGGLLGEMGTGVLFAELDAVAFKMKKGDISDVIETEIGFHILKVESITPKQTISLKEALPKIKQFLQDKQRRNCQKNWLAQQLKSFNG